MKVGTMSTDILALRCGCPQGWRSQPPAIQMRRRKSTDENVPNMFLSQISFCFVLQGAPSVGRTSSVPALPAAAGADAAAEDPARRLLRTASQLQDSQVIFGSIITSDVFCLMCFAVRCTSRAHCCSAMV